MIKSLFNIQIIYSLLILVFYSACNGQVKTKPTADVKNTETITIGTPKLVKTQGSRFGDNVHCSLKDKKGNLWLLEKNIFSPTVRILNPDEFEDISDL